MARKIRITLENRGTSNFNPQEAIIDSDDFAIIISNFDSSKKWEARISVDENNCPIFKYPQLEVCSNWSMPALKIKSAN